eukprot:TRINITY_DN26756_c0_g1_i1.p1 TRINITY_DN26756_c0_g1~~TRINITY_DN26756_c0_g1_i1.p1  ORF type:complete len:616 (+),score=70.97 TRINITY_DN26756_c0_g1_i1:109-1956(+)
MEDWRYGPLGRAGVLRTSGEEDDDDDNDVDDDDFVNEESSLAKPSVTQPISSASIACSRLFPGGEPEGSEDWRYGPTGRFHAVSSDASCGNETMVEEANARPDFRSAVAIDRLSGEEEDLSVKFQRLHNAHSSPRYGYSGEVRERTVWGYWADGFSSMPDIFKLCVETWRNSNPDWDIRILDDSNIYDFLSVVDLPNRFSEISSPQTASICVRLALLARYGGIWLNTSVVLRCGLDELCWRALTADGADEGAAAAFFEPRGGSDAFDGDVCIEGWCLGALSGNPLILCWRDLIRELLHNRIDFEGIVDHPLLKGVNLEIRHALDGTIRQGGVVRYNADICEQVVLRALFQHMLQRNAAMQRTWRREWQRFDSSRNVHALHDLARADGTDILDLLLVPAHAHLADHLDDIRLLKLSTQECLRLVGLPRDRLIDKRALLGRLLDVHTSAAHVDAPESRDGAPFARGRGGIAHRGPKRSAARYASSLASAPYSADLKGRVASAADGKRWCHMQLLRGGTSGCRGYHPSWCRPLPKPGAVVACAATPSILPCSSSRESASFGTRSLLTGSIGGSRRLMPSTAAPALGYLAGSTLTLLSHAAAGRRYASASSLFRRLLVG